MKIITPRFIRLKLLEKRPENILVLFPSADLGPRPDMKDSDYDIMNLIKAFDFEFNTTEKFLALSHICRSMQLLRVGSKGWPRGWSFNLSSAAISWTVLNIMQAFGLSGCHVTNLFDLSNFLELFPEKIPNDDLFMTRMNFNELDQGRISDKNDLIMIKWLHKNNDSLIMTR